MGTILLATLMYSTSEYVISFLAWGLVLIGIPLFVSVCWCIANGKWKESFSAKGLKRLFVGIFFVFIAHMLLLLGIKAVKNLLPKDD